jgi:hypothetical protein
MIDRMRSRVVLVVLFVLALCSVATVILAWGHWHRRNIWTRITVAQVDSRITRDLPVGTSRAEVASYLHRNKINHSYYGEIAGTKYYNSEIALIPRTASSGLVTTDVQIIFTFDQNMKLVSHQVHEVYKGP